MGSYLLSVFDTGFNAQLLIAALLGGLIGIEREIAGKDPSIRTFALHGKLHLYYPIRG